MYFVLKMFITRLNFSKWKISNDKVIKIRISLKYSLISISYFQSLIWGLCFCSMKNQELHIANVNKAWEGYFTCRANNSYGKSEAMAYVTVKGIN